MAKNGNFIPKKHFEGECVNKRIFFSEKNMLTVFMSLLDVYE